MKILLIDDEPDFVEPLSLQLKSEGFGVTVASDGPSGLEKARADRPDLVILDIVMPGMDGFEVLKRLRAFRETRRTPVLMLTARGETEAIFKAVESGSVDYLIKPFDLEELLKLIKRYLGLP